MALTLHRASARFPRRFEHSVLAIDAHTEGEPLRILIGGAKSLGFSPPLGDTMLAKRAWAQRYADQLRRQLMLEPRGHADMYGCWLTEPVTDDGDVGVLFLHNEGWSTMCGHGIIGLVKVGLEYDLFSTSVANTVQIDSPAGRIVATAKRDHSDRVESVSFLNVPSFVLAPDLRIEIPHFNPHLHCDLAYGGAFYAYVDAADLDLELTPQNQAHIVAWGRRIKAAFTEQVKIRHPDSPIGGSDLDFLYGVIFTSPAHDPENNLRNVCVFADGEVDRSPTGTGVSGRIAMEVAAGRHGASTDQDPLKIESILGTTFSVRAVASAIVGQGRAERSAVIPEVAGRAWITGVNEFVVAKDDVTGHGFLLR